MSKDQLIHIFDNSSCLSRRQMKEYVDGSMTNEESHTVQVHLNACPFCNDAIEGLFEQKEGNAVEMLSTLDTDFLKDHFSINHPHIHLNSMSPAAQPAMLHSHSRRLKKGKSQPLYRNASIAATILICFGLLWYFEFGKDKVQKAQLAYETTADATEQKGLIAANIPARENENAINPATERSGNTEPQPESNGPNSQGPQLLLTSKLPEQAEQKKEAELSDKNADMAMAADMAPAAIPAPVPVAAPKTTTADEPKALARGNTNAMTSGAAPATPNRVQAYSMQTESLKDEKTNVESRAKAKRAADDTNPEELYEQKKYSAALNAYKADLDAEDNGKRHKAMLMSAKSYIGLNQKDKARKMLETLVDESSGGTKREAKKLLKDLESE